MVEPFEQVECPNCRGIGETTGPERGMSWFKCKTCDGEGVVSEAAFNDFHDTLGAFHHD